MENKNYINIPSESGSVNISEDVIAVIAGAAASEVEGVAALSHGGREPVQMNNRKALARSVKVVIEEDGVTIAVAVIAEHGSAVARVGEGVQKAISGAVADACGVTPKGVDVKIAGVKLR